MLPNLRPAFVSWGCVLLIPLAVACSSAAVERDAPALGGPTAPSTTPPPAPAGRPIASLAIEQFTAKVFSSREGDVWYEPLFRLRETSGKSGATIQYVEFGGEALGPSCLGTIRVAPGETLDTFYTGEVAETWGYCALLGGLSPGSQELRLVVTFTDDDGRSDRVQATVPASR